MGQALWYTRPSFGSDPDVAWPGKPNLTPARRSHYDEKNNRWLPQVKICRNRGPRESSRPHLKSPRCAGFFISASVQLHLRFDIPQRKPLSGELAGPQPHTCQRGFKRRLLHEDQNAPLQPLQAQFCDARIAAIGGLLDIDPARPAVGQLDQKLLLY